MSNIELAKFTITRFEKDKQESQYPPNIIMDIVIAQMNKTVTILEKQTKH